jgi:DNA-binding XRE family transcriptional regulator
MELNDKIKKLREVKGLTQEAAARMVGKDQKRWSHWERGRSKPNHEDLQNISKVFNASLDYLLGNNINCTTKNTISGMLLLPVYNGFPSVAGGNVVMIGSMQTPHQIIGINVSDDSIWVDIQNNNLAPFATVGMALLTTPLESVEDLHDGDVIATMRGDQPSIWRVFKDGKTLNLLSETNEQPILVKSKEFFVRFARVYKIIWKGGKP